MKAIDGRETDSLVITLLEVPIHESDEVRPGVRPVVGEGAIAESSLRRTQ